MNVTFVVVDYDYTKLYKLDYRGSFHHGVAYISSYLKEHGHKVSLQHLLQPIDNHMFVESIRKKSPDLIAFTSFSHQFKEVKRLVSVLKHNLKIPIICGGVHTTIDAERALLESELDMVCVGEGEEAMLELVNTLQAGKDYFNIRNIWFKHKEQIIRNAARSLLEDLDKLPFPDWDLFRYDSLTETVLQQRVSILATRGCPKNCGFCCNHAMKLVYPNKHKYVRIREPLKVIEEIDCMLKRYPYLEEVCFLDDTAGLYEDWLEEFSYLYRTKFSLPVYLNTRIEIVNNDKNLESFRRMGVDVVSLGIESGDADVRRAINRDMLDADIIKAVKRCHEVGIKVLSYNIVGLPYEDTKKILKTIKLNAGAHCDNMHVSIFQPYPNTDLYNLCLKEGFIKNDDYCQGFFDKPILKQKTISRYSVIFAHRFFRIYAFAYMLLNRFPVAYRKGLEKILDFTFKNHFIQYVFLFFYYPITLVISNRYIKENIKAILKRN